MKLINWEKDANGSSAMFFAPKEKKFISSSNATFVAKSFMHDATVISASFPQVGEIAYGLLAGISVFGDNSAIFYGLYGASSMSENTKYCLRRSEWKKGFGTFEAVLNGFSSKVLFFSLQDIPSSSQQIIEMIDAPLSSTNIVVPRKLTNANSEFINKRIYYSIGDDIQDMDCRYWGRDMMNPYIEDVFQKIQIVFNSLESVNTMEPIEGSFRLSYAFDLLCDAEKVLLAT
ncbi:hypothetical protein ACO0LL_26215 [Undibacterium sp. TC4M20W]|uniref:hypothetical protein n=1 Tax=Undibacterium sp. TC4M20W TaxID=3413052 RepID=UPI003BF303C1